MSDFYWVFVIPLFAGFFAVGLLYGATLLIERLWDGLND